MPNSIYSASTTLTGSGLSVTGPFVQDTGQTTPPSVDAPQPDTFTVVGGATTICQFPSSGTFTRAQIMPQGAPSQPSTNVKTVYGVSSLAVIDVTGMPGWSAGSITIPATAGGAFAVSCGATEKLVAVYS